ncbi:Arylesterase [Nocardioides dokdonensis FR1436]|uniref:Arylesterase n=1 Tax=Nocardioides dokdonensis FR1436 TaxID=1300347 RepID=A0A1A9GMD6_9ACTN|nr:alpha/beta hydrolase [Nocardioides dokdonensis]ANH38651.1 Arylesterase [Nocardioides dokdonensis FR1436]
MTLDLTDTDTGTDTGRSAADSPDEPRTLRVPCEGGDLVCGVWGPEDPDAPVVLAVHGITAHHRCWPLVAAALPGTRVVAPDLRGRGRSAALPAPYGLERHARDLEQVLDHLDLREVTLVGHSMGAFVALTLAARIGPRATGLLLVDGGLPLVPPAAGVPGPDATPEDVLGPAAQRLTMTFESHAAYRDFWRQHPAFAHDWSPVVEGYVDYDLEGEAPRLKPSAVVAAVATDASQLFGGADYETAMRGLEVPTTFLRAPRGLMDEPQALYGSDAAARARGLLPQLRDLEVDDVNHYTIVLGPRGAEAVAAATRDLLA